MNTLNLKNKKINDPIYGFISIHSNLIYHIIETPYFQRLRRIKQTGLVNFVYPGANHTRFQHALGAMHLMGIALDNLKEKGCSISKKEYEGALIAILLHDVGHGPFSHTLEYSLLYNVNHEEISLLVMKKLNKQFDNQLDLAIKIFTGKYHRPFFYQLVSSELDIDRLDYLKRDSFFTSVSEGSIGSDRIIKLFEVVNEKIVVEEKGIYSIENFLNSRRLMYWQVYLHKTVVAADVMLKNILLKAKLLAQANSEFNIPEALRYFLDKDINLENLSNDSVSLNKFIELDDYDIWAAIKFWTKSKDKTLSFLSNSFLNRKLYKIKLGNEPFVILKSKLEKQLINAKISKKDISYYLADGFFSNKIYWGHNQKIQFLRKNGSIVNIEKITNITNVDNIVTKYYLCWSKKLTLPQN